MLFIAQGSYTDIQLQFLGFLTSKIGVLGRQNEELRGLEFCNLLLWALHLDLEKEMATHYSIIVWKIPWTEELGWVG